MSARIGKYRLVASLGRGGTADVLLAVSRGAHGFEKLIVLKRLRRELAHQPVYQGIFSGEARLSARLQHPNVVQTFEVGEDDGVEFIAMEYLDGQPLNRVLAPARRGQEPKLPVELAARIAAGVLRGLEYAHNLTDFDGRPLEIVHRDISPHNVFVTFEGEVKLVDFGVAKTSFDENGPSELGVLKGKLAYMAPEQALGQAIDRRADVFAVGVVLWEMLASRRLLSGNTGPEVFKRLLEEPLTELSSVVNVDPELERICERALEKDAAARYPSAEAMRADLETWLTRHGHEPSGVDDLRAWMRASFESERAKVKQQIQEIIATQRAGDESRHTPSLPAVSASTLTTLSLGTPEPAGAQSHAEWTVDERPLVRKRKRRLTSAAIALGAFAMVAGAIAIVRRRAPNSAAPVASASSSAPAVERALIALRLCGSNTVGAELAPAMVEAFFKQKGSIVSRALGAKAHTMQITATPSSGEKLVVEIESEGTATAFDGIERGRCDIGMASRAVTDDEAKKIASAGLGDLRTPGSEHVLALDGIAVVVHSNNPIRGLRLDQIAKIYAGEITDWSALGGKGPITIFARDDNSGTFDTFKHLVLGKRKLAPSAKRFADSDKLADSVAGDGSAIGFIGLAYVRSAKALAIAADESTAPTLPSAFTVTTESYLLSRRLFFYVPAQPTRPITLDLVSFALSAEGQSVVRAAGFVDLGVGVQEGEACTTCSAHYKESTKGAKRLSLDFRFRPSSGLLDSRAIRDLDRLVTYLRAHPGGKVRLLGFSDGIGDKAANQALSRERAKHVADELETRGVHASRIEGFGAERPVASNDDAVGREKNRRVEVWLETEN